MLEPELWGNSTHFLATLHKQHMIRLKTFLKWKTEESILEFGIGDGSNTKLTLLPILPQDYKEYIGTDISSQMIEHARNNLSDSRRKFIVLDISCQDIPDELVNRFDHIFSFCVMHWVQNTKQALNNIYKMLKPNGQVFLTYVDETSADEVYDSLSQHSKWGKYDHKRIISPSYKLENALKKYKSLFSEVGFVENYLEVDCKRVFKFEDEKMFKEFCLSVNPILKEVTKEDYEDYLIEFTNMMANNKLNFTTTCPKSGDISYHTSLVLNLVVLEKV